MNQPTNEPTDYLPISMLNQLEYCERRFYLMHVLGEMEINAHVLEGSLQHQRTDRPGVEKDGDKIQHRRVYVWSERLLIAGYADLVEEQEAPEGGPCLTPVEYKKGRMGRWLNDHIQLCAQALCLEERLETRIEQGYIFYFSSRRREEVAFSAQLRQLTEQAVRRANQIIQLGQLPPPEQLPQKCRDCSLERVCLPAETQLLISATIGRQGGNA
jgi:CRISPR-associated exonuclease Cas4